MEITQQLLNKKFKEYNKLYFDSLLKKPQLIICNSKHYVGCFNCEKVSIKDKKRKTLNSPKIEISNYYNLLYEDFRDILVHEMIHYFIILKTHDNKMKNDKYCHGAIFQKIANEFNNKYNLNIADKFYGDLIPIKEDKGFFSHFFS